MAEIHERFCCLYAAQSASSMLRPEHERDCRNYALLDSKGRVMQCGHTGCWRSAVRVVAWDSPKHREFEGQTHNCCRVHSRA